MLDDDDEGEGEEFQGSIPDPTEGLGPEIPSVSIPDATDTGTDTDADADVSSELLVTFWGSVITLDLALFATSLGVMLWYFRGQLRLGGGLFVLGVAAFAYAYYKYRRYLGRDDENDEDAESDGRESDAEDGAERDATNHSVGGARGRDSGDRTANAKVRSTDDRTTGPEPTKGNDGSIQRRPQPENHRNE